MGISALAAVSICKLVIIVPATAAEIHQASMLWCVFGFCIVFTICYKVIKEEEEALKTHFWGRDDIFAHKFNIKFESFGSDAKYEMRLG